MKNTLSRIIGNIFIFKLFVVIILFILPYLIFGGRMYLGGDDTRLFYSYPLEFLKNISFFSWYKVSSLGINGPNQYMVPFLSVWSLLGVFLNKLILNYLAFSLPLIFGFIYFQKALKELIGQKKNIDFEILTGSLFYILSPILIINQLFVFLISIWLIGIIPVVIYYFLRYLRTGEFKFVFIASIWCLIFGPAMYSIPWLLGFVLPVLLGLITVAVLFSVRQVGNFIKRSVVFFGFIFISQAYWLTGFISTYLNLGQDSLASKFLSKGFVDTYTPTILASATGNVFYALLNLFNRQIVLDFNWRFKDVFTNFYDYVYLLNLVFTIVIAVAVLNFRKFFDLQNRKMFIFLLLSLIYALYLFVVNIGPLKDLFIWFRHIPGFVMFRNFYDKFAIGYVLILASLLSFSLVVFTKKIPKLRIPILLGTLIIICVNFLPVKTIVNSPLWMTRDIYKTINIPDEYLSFMDTIKNTVSSSNNILSIPFGSSAYSVIKDNKSNGVYAGVSPVKIFSGVNDISGHYSFNFTKIADTVDGLIVNRNYQEFNKVLLEHNINYVLLTKNIPSQLSSSYLFNQNLFNVQDRRFINAITDKKLATSAKGNYELYRTKYVNSLINSKNVYFKKISQVEFIIYLKNLSKAQSLEFIDSYHPGWKLFIVQKPAMGFCSNPQKNTYTGSTECKPEDRLFGFSDLTYSFKKPIFEDSHNLAHGYANKWEIDPGYIKSNFSENYYKINQDGSMDLMMVLYFVPQNFFYLGIVVSILVFAFGFVYILFKINYGESS